jgi:hypothetical protein
MLPLGNDSGEKYSFRQSRKSFVFSQIKDDPIPHDRDHTSNFSSAFFEVSGYWRQLVAF